jgi:thiol-disulfide isomerase/thioredoxin
VLDRHDCLPLATSIGFFPACASTARRRLVGAGLLSLALVGLAGCDRTTPAPAVDTDAVLASTPPSQSEALAPSGGGGEPSSGPDALPPAGSESLLTSLSIEPSLPDSGLGTAENPVQPAAASVPAHLSGRSFMNLKDPVAEPAAILNFFGDCDRALQELALAIRSRQLDESQWTQVALRLSQQKLGAARQLGQLSAGNPPQMKKAIAAEVESLSHLASLGDLNAARQLQNRAQELTQSADAELAHQGRLVLLGFRMNQLQEGLLQDASGVVADIDQLVAQPQELGLVEFMAMEQCAVVLGQLGYKDEAAQIADRIVRKFRSASDPQLSMRAWAIEAAQSPEFEAFQQACAAAFEGTASDPGVPAAAADRLIARFPSNNTVRQVAERIVPLEYQGRLPAAAALAQRVGEHLPQYPGALSAETQAMLEAHRLRMTLPGQPLDMTGVVAFDGRPFDWSSYRGKVVVVAFWATPCIHCLRELPLVANLYRDLAPRGLEVVGVNMDENLADAEQRILRENFPWRTLRSADATALGFESPLAKRLGVSAIPFILVVDRAGRVVAVHQRGDQLRSTVEQLLAN